MQPDPTAKQQGKPGASPASLARRKFLNGIAVAAGTGSLLTLGALMAGRPASANPAQALRPPGALGEADFLGACIRCGLCVRDCPYDTLQLAPFGGAVEITAGGVVSGFAPVVKVQT